MAIYTGIKLDSTYAVKGEELIDLDDRVKRVFESMKYVRDGLCEALENVSNDNNGIPKFVAQIGLAFSALNVAIINFESSNLRKPSAGMDVTEVNEEALKQ